MKPGKKSKPTFLKLINGNPGGRPLNQAEPVPSGNLRDAPDWLTEAQKEGWKYAIEHAPRGLLKLLDRSVLEIWVVADDMHREAAKKVAQTGMLIKAPNTGVPIQSPYMAIKNKQATIMLKAAAELGFTPSSRSQIQVQGQTGNAFDNNGRRTSA